MRSRPGGRRIGFGAVAATLALVAVVPAGAAKKVKPSAVAVEPPPAGMDEASRRVAADAAQIARLALTLVPGTDVRWNLRESFARDEDAGVLRLEARSRGNLTGKRLADALSAARQTLESLPRRWRKRTLKRLARLHLDRLDRRLEDGFLDALGALAEGDPDRATALLAREPSDGAPPILRYLMAVSRLEGDDLPGAAAALTPPATLDELPPPLPAVARAVRAAAAGESPRALALLDGAVAETPSLDEARWLRAALRRSKCSLYDAEEIRNDLAAALRSNPCCGPCALMLSEMESYTGRPEEAFEDLRRGEACAGGALDSIRDRAAALAAAAAGRLEEAREDASRAESRDASALRAGLAPAYMLIGDYARLEQAYDSEGDARLPPRVSLEQHFYSGLAALWTGRPSEAATQFERAEEHAQRLAPGGEDDAASLQILRSLRIRSYLTAGRKEEAARAASETLSAAAGRVHGFQAYTAALAILATGDRDAALSGAPLPTSSSDKIWRYLLVAEADLAAGRPREAYDQMTLALRRVDAALTFCPGIPIEPYLLEPQARALLEMGRPRDAALLLSRLLALGARGLHAPDLVVPAWGLLGRAREAMGDSEGAEAAYETLIALWGSGEETEAVASARERLRRLSASPPALPP